MKNVSVIGLLAMLSAISGCGAPEKTGAGNATPPSAGQTDVELRGAGATFPAPLYSKWISDYNRDHANVKVDYQANGSGGGIKGITDRTIQFAGSDAPMTEEQLKAAPGNVLHLPTVAGPVAIVYHLSGVKELTLNGDVLADIYLGKIKKWQDPKIAALNPGVTLPDVEILVAHRSDGSGTTWILTNYLTKVSADWKAVGNATSIKWPVGIGGKGSDGVAKSVQTADGSIGYMELAFAQSANMPCATLINKAGKAVKPTTDGVVEAAKNSSEVPDDMRVSITDAPGDASYPISGYTYLLIYDDLSYLKNHDKSLELVKFINWGLHEGQTMAKPDYAPLSADLQKKVEAKLKTIVCDGQPLLK